MFLNIASQCWGESSELHSTPNKEVTAQDTPWLVLLLCRFNLLFWLMDLLPDLIVKQSMQAAWKDCLIRWYLTYGVFNISGFMHHELTKALMHIMSVPHMWPSTKQKCEKLNSIFNQLLILSNPAIHHTGLPEDRWEKIYNNFLCIIWQISTWGRHGLGNSRIEKDLLE